MLRPRFLLTNKIPLTLLRSVQGDYVSGVWVDGAETEVPVEVNIQPFKDQDLLLLPEPDRARAWYKLYCADEIRMDKQGTDGWGADEFIFEGDRYKVMKVKSYVMGRLDHYRATAARLEISAS